MKLELKGNLQLTANIAAAKEEAACRLSQSLKLHKKMHMTPPTPTPRLPRSKQHDVWDRLSSGKTLTEPEA